MKLGFLSALLILVFSASALAQDDGSAEQYRESCTEEANAAGMEGDELQGYVEACMREMQAENSNTPPAE